MRQLGAILMVLVACKGGDDKKQAGGKAGTTSGCEITAQKPAELVAGKHAQLIAPFTKIHLGMTRGEVAAVCPNFFTGDDAKKTGTFSVGEIVGKFGESYAQGRLEFKADKLDAVSLSLPGEIADALTAAWGAPKVSSGASPAHAWHDEATRLRAILEPAESDGRRALVVSTFMPLRAFVEAETKTIAWKPQDVLGKQPAELAKTFAQYLKVEKTSEAVKKQTDEMMAQMKKEAEAMGVDTSRNANLPEFELPASPFADRTSTQVILHTNDDGSVRSYGVWFRTSSLSPQFGWPTQGEELVKLFDELWGPHKTIKEVLGERMTWFDATRGVRAATRIEKPEDVDVVYVRYLPLAKLFGAPGPVWGFEKPERPLIGATPDEVASIYGKDYEVKRDDTAGTITMSLPPTDYDGDTARTTILMFVRGGKVAEWRTNIPFDSYEPAKAEYEALLASKFGAPKKAPRDHFLYGKKPKVDVEYSKFTHDLNIEVAK